MPDSGYRQRLHNFNPLPRKEGDTENPCMGILHVIISIHSLVKRETDVYGMFEIARKDFNPLPRKEGDLHRRWLFRYKLYFNPLPRKEGDSIFGMYFCAIGNFNPLPRKEGDLIAQMLIC